jgi:monofunctional biosynthetic peptidoglycan transglycosylase
MGLPRIVAILAGLAAIALVVIAVQASHDAAAFDVGSLARRVPGSTALMRQRAAEAKEAGRAYGVDQRWVPYERVSPLLRRAILVAEDDAFFSHHGLDWTQMRAAAGRDVAAGRVVRGGSTITQQLARNLYLGDARSLSRKLREVFLAVRLERALSKRRIFELYLNEIEWGDGVFGAEAASRGWFGVPAADLDARQACLLAAIIINPRRFSATHPSSRIERRVDMIASRLHRRGALTDSEYAVAIGKATPMGSFWHWLWPFGGGKSEPPAPPAAPETSAASPESAAAPDTLP